MCPYSKWLAWSAVSSDGSTTWLLVKPQLCSSLLWLADWMETVKQLRAK